MLRQFSVHYPIARACINYRKTQITQLDWTIAAKDEKLKPQPKALRALTQFFETPYGPTSRPRKLLDQIVEDIMVVDAVSLYKERTIGGSLIGLVPIDPTTIKLRIDAQGRTPLPPEIAYEQYIRGEKVAEMTTDELVYDMLNPRTNSPYGLSPLESLIVTVNTALRTAQYNSQYLTDGNIPEGFMELKPELASTPEQVQQWQMYFDNMVNGESRKLKAVPEGVNYTPVKKPDDMSFEKFELWLLQVTCAVFGVQPEEIGFTHSTNRATAEVQREVSVDRGLKPLGRFIEELFTNVIREEFGYEDLTFKFLDLDPVDEEAELKKQEHEIKWGIRSVDEIRVEDYGKDAIGLTHMVPNNMVLVTTFMAPKEEVQVQEQAVEQEGEMEQEEDTEKMFKEDLKKWRNKCIADIKRGRDEFRGFSSKYIAEDLVEEIEDQLVMNSSKEGVYKVFDRYLSTEGELVRKAEILTNEIRSLQKQD